MNIMEITNNKTMGSALLKLSFLSVFIFWSITAPDPYMQAGKKFGGGF